MVDDQPQIFEAGEGAGNPLAYRRAEDPNPPPVVAHTGEAPPKRKKRKKMRLYTLEQWQAKRAAIIDAHVNKGWSVGRIAKNMSVSTYRVQKALTDPNYCPRGPNDPRYAQDGTGKRPDTSKKMKMAPPPPIYTDDATTGEKEQAITDLITLIPSMRKASAAYWLRVIADLL